jgi:hypothetical protein
MDLFALEHAGWRSLCDGTGSEFYGALMTGDARMVLADGSVMDRAEVVAALDRAEPWESYSIDDPVTIEIGEDAAALVYVGTGVRAGQRFSGVMTSLYVRSDDGWRLALYQQTPLP